MSGKTALIIGATGNTGSKLLHELLSSPEYSKVGEYGRRVTARDTLPAAGLQKLEQKTIDFEKLGESGLKDGKWDVVFLTLGTTRKLAGSAENFEKIDREYVVNAAREARSSDSAHAQRVVYLSSMGADANSSMLYPKSKGQTELELSKLGYADTIIFRPAFLKGATRSDFRPLEVVFSPVSTLLGYVSSSVEININVLAKAIRIAGTVGSSGLPPIAQASKVGDFTVIGNKGAIALGKSDL